MSASRGRPRLGFVGLGWIGAMRLEAVADAGCARVAALCEPSAERLEEVGGEHERAERFADYDALLGAADTLELGGVVVATPNALHAPQATAALGRGLAVFCQKPLALDAAEAEGIIASARRAERLLGVDYSYRHTDGARLLKQMIAGGELGRVFHIESVFHNAYGPDKGWCRDPAVAGGGALMDLGVHQVDLPLWLLGYPEVRAVRGRALRGGEPLPEPPAIDDFATARLELEGGTSVHAAVSWNAPIGADCAIRTRVFGTGGGAEVRNIDGSFYDFETVRFDGRSREVLGSESKDWLGRGITAWADRLAESRAYDSKIERSVVVHKVIDTIYGRNV